ncbi:MAG: GTPase Era [Alphaproteobacteria bacterium]|jgi:GTP-binding protein Era|nr:GTPase Era [Alphaproteobacteria bacterium]
MTRCAFIAVIGAPNAGKSTLVNRLCGAKVSIVTHKVQTTRFPVRGVAVRGAAQLVFVDTPGVFAPRRRLDRAMVGAAWTQAREADLIVHLVDARAELAEGRVSGADRKARADCASIVAGLKAEGRQAILALNKIDTVRRDRLLELAARLHAEGVYGDVFMISAETGSGLEDLSLALAAAAPEGPWMFPADQTSDLSDSLRAAEITREKLYLRVHQELPYAASVETVAFGEDEDGVLRIDQTILVERDGQKAIVVGGGGQTLKAIGQAAREEISAWLKRPVRLFLTVRVASNWADDRRRFEGLGLDFET